MESSFQQRRNQLIQGSSYTPTPSLQEDNSFEARRSRLVNPQQQVTDKGPGLVQKTKSLFARISDVVTDKLNTPVKSTPVTKYLISTAQRGKNILNQPKELFFPTSKAAEPARRYVADTARAAVETIKGAGKLTPAYMLYRAAIGKPVGPKEYTSDVVNSGLGVLNVSWRVQPAAPLIGSGLSSWKAVRQYFQGKLDKNELIQAPVKGINSQPGFGEVFTDNVNVAEAIDIVFLATMFVAPFARKKLNALNLKAEELNKVSKILEVKPNASLEKVSEAFRNKIKQYPDTFTSNPKPENLIKRKELQTAYDVLSNAGVIDKKYAAAYDFLQSKLGRVGVEVKAPVVPEKPKSLLSGLEQEVVTGKKPPLELTTRVPEAEKVTKIASTQPKGVGGKVTLYHGSNKSVSKDNLDYGSFFTTSKEEALDYARMRSKGRGGKAVINKFEFDPSEVKLNESTGEWQYVGSTKKFAGGKYPEQVYKAMNDVTGSNMTKQEIDALPFQELRDYASQGFRGGRDEFDKLVGNLPTQPKGVKTPQISATTPLLSPTRGVSPKQAQKQIIKLEKQLKTRLNENLQPVEEAMAQVWDELEVAEPGQRIKIEGGETKGISSTFPSWIPDELKSRELFDKVMLPLAQVLETGKYPKGIRTKQRELLDAILDEIDDRSGIDTSDIRSSIMSLYEGKRPTIQPKKEVYRGIEGAAKAPEVQKAGEVDLVEKELAKEVEKRVGEVQIPIGLQVREVHKPPLIDKIQGLEKEVKFGDEAVEKRYQDAKGISTEGYYQRKIKEFADNLYRRATRTYPDLPSDPKYAEVRNILNKTNSIKQVAQDKTARILQGITTDIGQNKLDLMTRKVILDDLAHEAVADRALPLGYSFTDAEGNLVIKKDLLKADKEAIDRLVFANPDVAEALARRTRIWKAITDELVKFNILKEEQVKEDYFRHQILEYVNTKSRMTKSVGPGLKERKPGYAKQRQGSVYDINTDYLQAEFEVMSNALRDIEVAKLLKQIEDLPINIKSDLVKKAERLSTEEKKIDWHELIPDGYVTWQPKDGRVFYQAYTIPERVVNEFVDQVGEGILKIDASLIKKATAIGKLRKELVLPEGVAKTLDNLWTVKQPNWVRDTATGMTTLWKKWVLFNPRRVIKYNYQNFLGDTDAVIAGNPAVFKKLPQSVKELYAVFAEDAPMTETMRDFFERGGFSSMLTVQEIPDIKNIRIFERFYKSASKKETVLQKLNIFKGYWDRTIKWTQFRESTLRYAAYLDNIERFGTGKKLNFGASNRKDVLALSNTKDQAAKVATELLGDYANITALGKDLRESVIPFYSLNEINITRYPKILKNAWADGIGKGAGSTARTIGLGAVKGAWGVYKALFRMIGLTGAVIAYNQIFHADAESELSEYDRGRMHINLGYNKDGEVVILRGQGAFSDMLEWFGLDEAPVLWNEYFDGKASLVDIFGKVPLITGQVGVKPLVQKLLGSISPTYKIPTEFVSGYTWPYQGTSPYPITDKWRQIFQNVQLENEYDWIFQKPSRGYLKSWQKAILTVTDPKENAYRYIQEEKYKFLATKGKGGTGSYYTPRSIVYRAYKKALIYGDKVAEQRAWDEMQKMGVKPADLQKSLEAASPLSGLSIEERNEFLNKYLTTADKVKLEKAKTYYNEVFLGRGKKTSSKVNSPIADLVRGAGELLDKLVPEVQASEGGKKILSMEMQGDQVVTRYEDEQGRYREYYKHIDSDLSIIQSVGKVFNDFGTKLHLPELKISEKLGYKSKEERIKEILDYGDQINNRFEENKPVEERVTASPTPTPSVSKAIATNYDQVINTTFGDEAENAKRVLKRKQSSGKVVGENTIGKTGKEADYKNTDGSIDRGLFRINSRTFNDFQRRKRKVLETNGIYGWDDMLDPGKNTKMAKLIYDEQGFDAWVAAPEDLLSEKEIKRRQKLGISIME